MEQQWTQALHDCTKRKEWTEVRDFVDRNAVLFGNSDSSNEEHGEGEYALYVQFRALVTKILDALLNELGCKSDDDEMKLANWLRRPDGPRDETAKKVLEDLLAIDDFGAFARMMRRRNDELELGDAAELEREMLDAKDAKGGPASPLGAKHTVFSDSDAGNTPVHHPGLRTHAPDLWEGAFESTEAANRDFEVQHATALSVLDADRTGTLPAKEKPFVGWAEAFVAVAREVDGALWRDDPRRAKRLAGALARQRFAVELAVAQSAVFEDRAARAEAARAAAVGGDDERSGRVAAALDRCDTLQRALGYLTIKSLLHNREDLPSHADDIHGALANARASAARGDAAGPGGDGDDDDEPGSAASLAAVAADLVSWCALEAELGTVQKRLNGMLGEDGDAASEQAKAAALWKLAAARGAAEEEAPAAAAEDDHAWHELLDLNTNYLYYHNSETGESSWEAPESFLPLDEAVKAAAIQAEEQAAAYHDAAGVDFFDDDPTADNGNSFSWSGYVAHGTVVSEVAEAKDAKDERRRPRRPSFRGLSVDTRELPPPKAFSRLQGALPKWENGDSAKEG
ncbi:hypothetical protein JL722_14193 [Aureococcus anophagefferens]|nr:hypothetical protein JL722_14193 [Aureococcus anophagefferens]